MSEIIQITSELENHKYTAFQEECIQAGIASYESAKSALKKIEGCLNAEGCRYDTPERQGYRYVRDFLKSIIQQHETIHGVSNRTREQVSTLTPFLQSIVDKAHQGEKAAFKSLDQLRREQTLVQENIGQAKKNGYDTNSFYQSQHLLSIAVAEVKKIIIEGEYLNKYRHPSKKNTLDHQSEVFQTDNVRLSIQEIIGQINVFLDKLSYSSENIPSSTSV